MSWTTDLPSHAGWYWMKRSQAETPVIILVETYSPPSVCAFSTALMCRSMTQLAGTEVFQGPLTPSVDAPVTDGS